MAKQQRQAERNPDIEDKTSLKGTLASVFLLGIFILVSWVSVYFLFVERF